MTNTCKANARHILRGTHCGVGMAVIATVLVLVFSLPVMATAGEDWFVSLYGGQFSDTALNEIIRFETDFEESHVYVLSVGQKLGVYKDRIGYEWEGQVATHTGLQDHQEINVVFTLRWLPFPWDRFIDTSFAVGNGISFATEDPPLEIREGDDNRTSQWLYYILVELAFALPDRPQYELFTRLHHRSSVFGLVDGIVTGSNFVGVGLRYRF